MTHRNLEGMIYSACDAISSAPEEAVSVNQIFNRQKLPRLPRNEIEEICENMVNEGNMELVVDGYMRYYRWKPDF